MTLAPGDELPLNLGRTPLGIERMHYRRDGSVKATWDTGTEAKRTNKRMRSCGGASLDVYRCQFCRGWHMGGGTRA